MDSRALGMKIRKYRAKRGWSIDTCSENIGITPRYLADIERGDKTPKLETFITILNVLSASADDVLQGSLSLGYIAQSNNILSLLDSLDTSKRKQALEIFESVIGSLKNG